MIRLDGLNRMNPLVGSFTWNGRPLAWIVRAGFMPTPTTFLTPNDAELQLGFVVHASGDTIPPHVHHPVRREVKGWPEVVVLRQGRCEVDLINEHGTIVVTRTLEPGDVLLLAGAGHAFRMLETTSLLELKAGPYLEHAEREIF